MESQGSLWLSSLSVLLTSCVCFYPAVLSSSALSLQLIRVVWYRLRFFAVLFVVFNKEYEELTPYIVDVFFPFVHINLAVTNYVYPASMPLYMEVWNVLLTGEFLLLNLGICASVYSYGANMLFLTLQSSDIQLTICWVFCKWGVPDGFWSCAIPFALAVQWLLLGGLLPATTWAEYREWAETAFSLYGRFWKEDGSEGFFWCFPLAELSLWILCLQTCSMWFSVSVSIQVGLSCVAAWLFTWVYGQVWPYKERVVNLVVEDVYEGLILAMLLWVPFQHPLILAVIVCFSLRKAIYH